MRCPLKEDNFGRMPDCQPDCAWMVNGACAVAAKHVDAHDERANLAREIGTLRAERDRYRELCGKLLDAADEMRRVRDAFDQFERGEA